MTQRDRFQVLPAVDVLGTEAVRLLRGDYDEVTLREEDPYGLVASFAAASPAFVHVVDLTAARVGGVRPDVISRTVAAAAPIPVQAAGGVRSTTDALALVGAGAARVVVGTAAFGDDELLGDLVALLGDRLVVAVDVRDGVVAVEGWTRGTALRTDAAVTRCIDAGVTRILCTAIERDGTLSGPSLELLEEVCASELRVLAAGGVRSVDDLVAIDAVGCEGAVVGRALLDGSIPLSAIGWRERRVESRA